MIALPRRQLLAYGLLGAPLAMAALPLYVLTPKLYADTLGLGLALTGLLVLAARLVDALQDPLLGAWMDRWPASRATTVGLAAPLLGLGLWALLAPPQLAGSALGGWLLAGLILTSTGYSLLTIAHNAWGAELSADPHQRTRITATREGFGLAGVLLATALPVWLASRLGETAGYARFALLFLGLLAVCLAVTLAAAPRPARRPASGGLLLALRAVRGNRPFLALAGVLLLSATAAAIPASLVLFYVEGVIGRADLGWLFLLGYFLAGAAGMPLWLRLSRRWGKRRAWGVGMGLACAGFVWAALLGPGDVAAFTLVCLLSGLALGADLALAPSLIADLIDAGPEAAAGGSYFGVYSLLSKLSLALGAGVALPLVQVLGYDPARPDPAGLDALAAVYALLPCLLKALAAALLLRAPCPERIPA